MLDENGIIEKVKLATKAIQFYFSKRILGDVSTSEFFDELTEDYIGSAVELWAGHTYVGIRKQKQIQGDFQEFYTELTRLLIAIREGSLEAT